MAGAERDLESLCEELGPSLYRLALSRTGQPADAEDLVQEALMRLLRALGRGRVIDEPLYWCLRVVSNAVRRRGRHGWRWVPLDGGREQREQRTENASAIAEADISNAALAFASLKKADRIYVALADLQSQTSAGLGQVLGTSDGTARVRLMRSRAKLSLAYMRQAVGFSPQTSECEAMGTLIPRWCEQNLDPRRSALVEAHLAVCEDCNAAQQRVAYLVKNGLKALLPIPADQHKRLSARLTAALASQGEHGRRRSPFGWWPFRSEPEPGERRRRRAAPVLLVLLLVLILLTPHGPASPSFRFQVESLRTSTPSDPASASVERALPTPLSLPSPTLVSRPSPAVVAAADPCPGQTTGAYAYLDRGELYLRSRIGAPAQDLTSSGGRVDYYWWSPNGALLAYKTSPGSSTLGTVSILEVATRRVLATLGQQAIFFSFSPDSSSWVAVAPIVQNTAYHGQPGFSSFQVSVGGVSTGNVRSSFTVAGIPNDVQPWPGNYAEQPDLPIVVADEPWGVYWLRDTIYLDQGSGGQMTHTFTEAGDSPSGWTMQSGNLALQDQFWSVPADSAFALNPASGDANLYVSCAGLRGTIWQPQIQGPAETLSVSPDGRTALITDLMLLPCRNDNYLVTADSVGTKLDADCYSSLARWQP